MKQARVERQTPGVLSARTVLVRHSLLTLYLALFELARRHEFSTEQKEGFVAVSLRRIA